MSRRRRTLTANRKRDALMRCDDIARALKSLAMGTLNRHAKIADTDYALRLAASVERLRDRIWKYPIDRRDLPTGDLRAATKAMRER